jgi:hypothetical protein
MAVSYNDSERSCPLSTYRSDRFVVCLRKVGGDVTDEEAILAESMDNLREATQRIRATRNRLRASGLNDHPNYRELADRVTEALVMTEAAFVEASRRSERGNTRRG